MNQTGKRILFVNHTAEISGPSNSLLMLVRYLKERFDPAVLLPEKGQLLDWLDQEGVRCFVIPGLRKESIPQIYHLIRREGYDLLYGNTPSKCSRNSMVAARLAGKPFIWHIRSMKSHWTYFEGFFLRMADAVIAVSDACAESLHRFYPREKIHTIYNGVEIPCFDIDRVTARQYLARSINADPKDKFVISVSHLYPRKGHEQAMEIMAYLKDDPYATHLVIAGSVDSDEYTARIRKIIIDKELEKRVHLLGLRTDIPNLLRGADVFLHTANKDPHPRAVIEAMAAELPVVAFGVDGVAETVVDGQTGYLLPVNDVIGMNAAVRTLLNDPRKVLDMGKNGRERVAAHFTAVKTAGKVAQVIEKLL